MKHFFILVLLTVTIANLALVRSILTPLSDNQLTDNGYIYGDLGSFSKNPPFEKFSLYKESDPETIGLEFLLYNNESPDVATRLQYNNQSSVRFSGFNRNYKLKVIVHGYGNDKNTDWVNKMKNEFFKAEKTNIMIVNWGPGAKYPDYKYAAANSRVVGKALELLVKQISEIFYPDDEWNLYIHCIGHSLGAHVCAYASDRYKVMFNRITGLDPARELFEGSSNVVRIDIRDAIFVDVIHTDAGNFGMAQETGRVDFYVNGGSDQPGCNKTFGGDPTKSCNHKRAYEYFIETINPGCPFTAYKCDSWQKYENGECLSNQNNPDGQISVLGYFADDFKVHGKFYTASMDKSPYCAKVYQYEVIISSKQQDTKGVLSLVLNKTEELKFTQMETPIQKEDVLKGMIKTRLNIGYIENTSLMFKKKSGVWCLFCPAKEVFFNKIKIQYYDSTKIISYCLKDSILSDGRAKTISLHKDENKGDCKIE